LLSSFENTLFLDGDDGVTRELLHNPSTEEIKNIIGHHKIVFIDEVQRIDTIGITSKIIVDQFKEVQLIVSGSSAFDIKNKTSESLTGRKWEYTVANYIQILEKGFVIFTLTGYSKNLRNELKFAKKIYFWDNGVRNTIINNFNSIEMRNDKGELWENFIISERMKKNNYENPFVKSHFGGQQRSRKLII
jgi:predicted AAA+ superfamily ATPase